MTIDDAVGLNDKNYTTSGGLHGVGVSVVNALSSELIVEITRNNRAYIRQFFWNI